MSTLGFCHHCFIGVRHEGNPSGTFTTINGVNVYIATPSGEFNKEKVLLYFPDVFGLELPNHQLQADDFALNGIRTVVVDYFGGDPLPADAMDPGSTYDFFTWLKRHLPPSTKHDIVQKVIDGLKAEGVKRFATTGYCFGARIGFDFALKGETHVTTVSHPTLIENLELLEKYITTSAPLLINSCEVDQQFPADAQGKADEIFGGGKFAPGYERTYWPGCVHGFAVRGDMSDPKVKAGKEGAFKATVEFVYKYL
ncbi:alpha/beta-hydrolase [Abortiporus biennis]|nr:alpha/beta-hydrolase [Abortiporus biennis]